MISIKTRQLEKERKEMTQLSMKKGGLEHPAVIRLLQDHLDQMAGTAPPESRHALDLSGLKQSDVHFYGAWVGDDIAGCGAFKVLDNDHAEVKSMKTATEFLRQGVAGQVLAHLMAEARGLGIKRFSLETGSMGYFEPARAMYQRLGFELCAPFGNYKEDPNSVFMTKIISE